MKLATEVQAIDGQREEVNERPLERKRKESVVGRKASKSLEHCWIKVTVDFHNDKSQHNVS